MSVNETPQISMPFSLLQNKTAIHVTLEVVIYGITSFYFYKKINHLTNQVKELETKVENFEKVIYEQKQFITQKINEITSTVTSQMNRFPQRQFQPEFFQSPNQVQQPPQQVQQAQQQVQQHVQQVQQHVQQVQQPPQQAQQHVQQVQQPPQQAQQHVQQVQQQVQQHIQQKSRNVMVETIPMMESMVIISSSVPEVNNNKMVIEEDNSEELDRDLECELNELNSNI